jgi:hypothetical protein
VNYGIIRGIAAVWIVDRWVFRLLVLQEEAFSYFYIGACNYRFRIGDIVSWSGDLFFWHAENRTVWFDLLQSGVEAK